MRKRGQQTMGMPFGFIFSLFLIVVFIVIAFIVIKSFLGFENQANVGLFYLDLQDKVNNAKQSQSTDLTFDINLPSKIKKICFANLSAEITGSREDYKKIEVYQFEESNVFLIPPEEAEGIPNKLIKYIDIKRITRERNPYCIDLEKHKELKIKKDFYDKMVLIE